MSDYGSSSRTNEIFAEKDPDSTEDFAFNWASWLEGDVIETSAFFLPDGLTEVSNSFTSNKATIFVTGGEPCTVYRITNRITTVGLRTRDKTIRIRVKEQ